jgi:hypothetical protein
MLTKVFGMSRCSRHRGEHRGVPEPISCLSS